MPVTKSAKATLNSNVWSSPHLARNVGKMLSNVAMMIESLEGYGVGNTVGAFSNWNFAAYLVTASVNSAFCCSVNA
jgi:hypothetical protein